MTSRAPVREVVGGEIRLAVGEVAVAVPADTPAAAIARIEALLVGIDEIADRTAQLHVALDSRVAIEQAKGIIAERNRVRPPQAFELLRATARRRRLPLHALAAAVVAGRTPLQDG